MDYNKVISLVALGLFVLLILGTASFQYSYNKIKRRNQRLISENALFKLGKKEKLTFLQISKLQVEYAENTRMKDTREFEELAINFIASTIKNMVRFEQLNSFFEGFDGAISQPMFPVYQTITKKSNADVGVLLSNHLKFIKQLGTKADKERELRAFIDILQGSALQSFAFCNGNLNEAIKFLKELKDEDSEGRVLSIATA
jgi:hypothetical protein